MAARKPDTHHVVLRCLLALHEKAHGTELDGEGIQAWLEWEMEALRWGVSTGISRDELEALVGSSEVSQPEERHLLSEDDRTEPEKVGEARTGLKPPETISNGKERA